MVTLPTFIMLPRKTKPAKKINLWYNSMHNTHRFIYNEAKTEFKNYVANNIGTLPRLWQPIKIVYTFYSGTKQLWDITNQCVYVDKFFCDALVELWYIPDDNYNYICEVGFKYGGYDKGNQRIEATIYNVQNLFSKKIFPMTIEELIIKLQKYIKENPEHKNMLIWDMTLDIAATDKNITFKVDNWMLTIQNWLFTW